MGSMTEQIKHSRHSLEEELESEEGRRKGRPDEAGWEWRTMQKKQTVPGEDLPL